MTEDEVRSLVQRGEGETLEFKNRLPGTNGLAQLIAGFANTQGGKLIAGYNGATGSFVGIGDAQKARERLADALRHVEPQLQVTPEFVQVDGKEVLVVDVPRGSEFPYLANGLATIRRDDDVVPINPPQILEYATQRGGPLADDPTLKRLAVSVAKIEERTRRMKTVPISVGCAVLGAGAGYLLKALDPLKDLLR